MLDLAPFLKSNSRLSKIYKIIIFTTLLSTYTFHALKKRLSNYFKQRSGRNQSVPTTSDSKFLYRRTCTRATLKTVYEII